MSLLQSKDVRLLCDFVYLRDDENQISITDWILIFHLSVLLSFPYSRDIALDEIQQHACPVSLLGVQYAYCSMIHRSWAFPGIAELSEREDNVDVLEAKQIGEANCFLVSKSRALIQDSKRRCEKFRPPNAAEVKHEPEKILQSLVRELVFKEWIFLVFKFAYVLIGKVLFPHHIYVVQLCIDIMCQLCGRNLLYATRNFIPPRILFYDFWGSYPRMFPTECPNELVFLKVENSIFPIHKHLLRESELFQDMWKVPFGDKEPEGLSKHHPIIIPQFSVNEFRLFIWYLYNSREVNHSQPLKKPRRLIASKTPPSELEDRWIAILRLSHWAIMNPTFEVAKNKLEDLQFQDPFKKLKIRKAFNFPYRWAIHALVKICSRPELYLSLEEVQAIGTSCSVLISNTREKSRLLSNTSVPQGKFQELSR